MKVIHYYPSVYTMFKQMAEKSLTDSSFVLQSKELEDYEKTKGGRVELDPEIKLSQLVLDIEKNVGSNIIYIDPSVYINPGNVRGFYKYMLNFKDVDLCMATHIKRKGHSSALMKIKCTKKTLAFFEHALSRVQKNSAESEEPILNNMLKEWEGRITFEALNSKVCCTPFITSDAIRTNYYAWHVMSRAEGLTTTKLYDSKVKIVFDHRFINREDYNYYKL